jgi:glycosyltransferase involved in cell wall biosynthesis
VHVRGRLPDYSWFLRPGFRRALFVSRDLLDYALATDAKAFRPGYEVLYDGVLMQDLPDAQQRQDTLSRLGIPTDIPSIVLSGQVVAIKGIWEYIEAARILTESGSRATFVVLGDDLLGKGATRAAAEERVRALGLEHRFRFLGFRRDAPHLIPMFDIAAVPSHQEPLGNATLEAMASSLPGVGSRVGGIPEMIVEGETGFLIPPQDAASLASALRGLIEDAALRTRLGTSGRSRAESMFSVAAHVARVQGVYDEILAQSGRPS